MSGDESGPSDQHGVPQGGKGTMFLVAHQLDTKLTQGKEVDLVLFLVKA